MYIVLLNLLVFTLADDTFLPLAFNKDAVFKGSLNGLDPNPYAVLPLASVQQSVSLQWSSFNPPQEQNAWSVLPQKYNVPSAEAILTHDVNTKSLPGADFNPDAVFPATKVQQSSSPSTFNPSLDFPQVPYDQSTTYRSDAKGHFSDSVQAFANNFVQRVLSSPVYTNAFSMSKVSAESASKLFHDYVYSLTKRKGDKDPEFSSFSISLPVKNYYKSMTNKRLMEIHAYAAGELFYQTGHLTPENWLELSNKYFQILSNDIDAVKDDSPQEKLRGAMNGFRDFIATNSAFNDLGFVVASVFSQVYNTLSNSN